jgi:hypothetical protein
MNYMNEEVEELIKAALHKLKKNSALLNKAVALSNDATCQAAFKDGVYEVCWQLELALSQNAMYKIQAAKQKNSQL